MLYECTTTYSVLTIVFTIVTYDLITQQYILYNCIYLYFAADDPLQVLPQDLSDALC